MSLPPHLPEQHPVEYPETGYPEHKEHVARRRFWGALAAAGLLLLGFIGGMFYAHIRSTDARSYLSSVSAPPVNLCAESPAAERERDKLLRLGPYASGAALVQTSGGTGTWCVLGHAEASGSYWGIAYVGLDNPIYVAMTTESGDVPEKPRARLTYPGSPPVTLARNGWIGFATPSGGEPWTELRAGAATMMLFDLATKRR